MSRRASRALAEPEEQEDEEVVVEEDMEDTGNKPPQRTASQKRKTVPAAAADDDADVAPTNKRLKKRGDKKKTTNSDEDHAETEQPAPAAATAPRKLLPVHPLPAATSNNNNTKNQKSSRVSVPVPVPVPVPDDADVDDAPAARAPAAPAAPAASSSSSSASAASSANREDDEEERSMHAFDPRQHEFMILLDSKSSAEQVLAVCKAVDMEQVTLELCDAGIMVSFSCKQLVVVAKLQGDCYFDRTEDRTHLDVTLSVAELSTIVGVSDDKSVLRLVGFKNNPNHVVHECCADKNTFATSDGYLTRHQSDSGGLSAEDAEELYARRPRFMLEHMKFDHDLNFDRMMFHRMIDVFPQLNARVLRLMVYGNDRQDPTGHRQLIFIQGVPGGDAATAAAAAGNNHGAAAAQQNSCMRFVFRAQVTHAETKSPVTEMVASSVAEQAHQQSADTQAMVLKFMGEYRTDVMSKLVRSLKVKAIQLKIVEPPPEDPEAEGDDWDPIVLHAALCDESFVAVILVGQIKTAEAQAAQQASVQQTLRCLRQPVT